MKTLALVLLAGLVLVAILSSIVGSLSNNAAQIAQAQAQIETARAARVAATGTSITSVIATSVLGLVVLFVLAAITAAVFAYFYNRRNPETPVGAGKWKGGSYAYWGRVGDGERREQLPAGDRIDRLIRLEELKLLQKLSSTAQLPARNTQYQEDEVRWDL